MKYNNFFMITSLSLLSAMVYLSFNKESLIMIWILLLILSFLNKSNHFISLLLILEMFSMLNLMMISFFIFNISSVSLMFILMTFSVGEAVMGLAILVKLIRWNYSEMIFNGLH